MKKQQIAMAVWQAADILEAAPEYFTRHNRVLDSEDFPVPPNHKDACKFCAHGLVDALLDGVYVAQNFTVDHTGKSLSFVNDSQGRKAAIKLMRKACLNWEKSL